MIQLARSWFRRLAAIAVGISGRLARRLARQSRLKAIVRSSVDVYPPLGRLVRRLMRNAPLWPADFRPQRPKLTLSLGSRSHRGDPDSSWNEALKGINLASSPEHQRAAMDRLLLEIASRSKRNNRP